ncbi:prophage pi3 protein 34 [Lactococcus lactis subsp. lactis]|uniref:Prophage pi3 protein 34 n=1 Tax=Lactococcus lactis subsp. lactis TaxID=1360 RepID=A0A0V8E0S6_LACLL|nr:hypothetical protein [Lactococcus lactis]KSU19454.1 prophage pi3 protein 34 [Lactococcus lactis subsp. lactis]
MTDISGKSMEEIYREEARRYKESIEKGRVYSESEDILTGNFDKSESLAVTMPMEEFDKLEKLALSAHTDKLSVEKLQEQLNTVKKALMEILFFSQGCYDSEYFASIARKALAAIGGGGCPVGAVGKNGLTKEELEGSGDE